MMLQIKAPHFVAGLHLDCYQEGWLVDITAPILSYMNLWTFAEVEAYCAKRNWQVVHLDSEDLTA